MKYCFPLCLILVAGECFAQLNRQVAVSANGSFLFALQGFGTNEAGIGLSLESLFFAKNKVGVLVEGSAVRFIGDKLLVMDPTTGEKAGPAALYSVKAGPQLFVGPNVALAATYGPVWHRVRDFRYTLDDGFRISLTHFMGKQKRIVTKMFLEGIPAGEQTARYAGVAAGFRF